MLAQFGFRRRLWIVAAAFVASLLAAVSTVSAQALTWDGQGINAPSDGSGTWDADIKWNNGNPADIGWSDYNDAVFGANNGAAGTVTVNTQVTPNSITFNPAGSGNYLITGGNLTLPVASTPISLNNTNATISSLVVGLGGFSMTGPGTLTLTNQNTFQGPTTVVNGTLRLSAGGPPGTLSGGGSITINGGGILLGGTTDALGYYNHHDSNVLNINEGGVLSVVSGSRLSMDRTVICIGGTITAQGAGDDSGQTYTFRDGSGGKFTFQSASDGTPSTLSATKAGLNGNTTFNVMAGGGPIDLNVTGTLADNFGVGNLIKNGDGVMVLANANTFSGSTLISQGTLQLGNNLSIQNSALNTSGTGTLVFSPGVDTPTFGGLTGGTNLTLPSSVTSLTLNVGNGANLTYSGNLVSPLPGMTLTKTGAGTQVLSGVNTYTGGTQINAGILNINGDAALGAANNPVTYTGNSTLQTGAEGITLNSARSVTVNSGVTATIDTAAYNNMTIAGVIGGQGSLTKIGAGTLTLTNNNSYTGGTTVSAGALQLGDGSNDASLTTSGISNSAALVYDVAVSQTANYPINGAGTLTKVGTGTLTLTAANTYTGNTTNSAGTLNLSNSAALQNSTLVMNGGNLVFDSSVTTNAFTLGGLQTSGTISGSGFDIALESNAVAPAPVALTVGTNNADTNYWGVLSGSGSLVKVGNGTLSLHGTNTYTGGTTVKGGILRADTDAQFGAVPTSPTLNITLDNGELFDNGENNNHNPLTISGSRTIYLGNGGGFVRSGYGMTTTINGQITGPGGFGVVWDGSPLVLTNAANDYQGDTTIGTVGNGAYTPGGARLDLGVDNAIPFGPGKGNVVFLANPDPAHSGNQAYLFLNGHNAQINGLTGGTNAVIDSNAGGGPYTLTVGNNNQSSTFGGIIRNSISLTKTGSGNLTLIGTNAYSGSTAITGGTLQIGDGTAGHDSSIPSSSVLNNAALVYNINGNQTYSGAINGTGSLTKAGNGTLTLTNNNTYSGATIIAGGTLQLPGPQAMTTGLVNYYPLTGNTNDTVGGRNGTIVGSGVTLSSTGGKFSTGTIYLPGNGSGAVSMGSLPAFSTPNFQSPVTISAWVQVNATPNNWSSNLFGFLSNNPQFVQEFYFDNNGNGTVLTQFYNDSKVVVPNANIGSWHLLTAAWDGNVSDPTQIYVDGGLAATLAASNTVNQTVYGSDIENIFGIDVGRGGFQGYENDLRVYSVALTESQVAQLYSSAGALNGLPVTTTVQLGAASGGTAAFDLNGGSQQVAAISDNGSYTNGLITNSSTGLSVLTVTPSTGVSTTYSGTIQDGNGKVGLVLTGTGTLTLAGVNTYTGGTDVLGGTLIVTHANGLQDGTSLTVGADASTIFGAAAAGTNSSAAPALAAVPEPGTLVLLLAGLAVGFGVWRKRGMRG